MFLVINCYFRKFVKPLNVQALLILVLYMAIMMSIYKEVHAQKPIYVWFVKHTGSKKKLRVNTIIMISLQHYTYLQQRAAAAIR